MSGAVESSAVRQDLRGQQRLAGLDLSALLLMTFLASWTPIAVGCAVASIPPIIGGVMRFLLAALTIGLVLLARRKFLLPVKADWPLILILGVVCVPVNQAFFWGGVAMANPSHAAMLYSTTPVIVTVLSCLIRIERWSWRAITGAVLAVVGVIVILLDSGLFLRKSFLSGDLLLLGAAATWSGYLVFSRRLNQHYGSLAAQFWIFLCGALVSIPLLLIKSQQVNVSHITLESWLGLGYLIFFVAVGVFFLYNWCNARQPPSRVATFGNAALPLTLVWEAMIKERLPGIWFLVGSVILLTGMFLAIYRPRTPASPPPTIPD
ncbi:MAG: DMT family transporter [Phycisphaerae bacterium]